MTAEHGGARQAWLVLSTAAIIAVAILVLSVNAMLPVVDGWAQRIARDDTEAAAPSPATRVLTAAQLAAIRQSGAATTAPRLLSDPVRYFGPEVYPDAAIRAGEQGRVVALLSIGPTGGVRACAILTGSGSGALDAATCRQAERMRFAPALNAQGAAVASDYRLPVRWQLPG